MSDPRYRVLNGRYYEPYFLSQKIPRVGLLFLDLSENYKDQITFLKKMMYLLKYSSSNQSVVFHLIATKADLAPDKELLEKTLGQAKADLELFSRKHYIHIGMDNLHHQLSQSIKYMHEIPTPHKKINAHWFASDLSTVLLDLENIIQQIVTL